MHCGRPKRKLEARVRTIETVQTTIDFALFIERALKRNPSESLLQELSEFPLPGSILRAMRRRCRGRRAALIRLVEIANDSLELQRTLMHFLAPGYRLRDDQTAVPAFLNRAA